jgi:tRNA nucleotidyltransferase (CCA-adding enzyme)
MHLILTHEQADLDALASMLGAHILHPEAYALLPRQINRNGRQFLKRFGAELGFSTIQELPREPIDTVLLVDTQSLVTLRGLHEGTKVSVIDHHPRKQQSHSNWTMELGDTGACTTLLVEKIQQQGLGITSLQATLMLLGIYEDTGSLLYSNTSPRDAKAVSFLLENEADLNIVSHYLNPPLSNVQQQLYDRLMTSLTSYTIEGYDVLLASAEAFDLNDEISSVAHKLREFLDPDGLVMVVSTRQGVRLVGRSTTDNLDMAALARHFQGGGHKRASSALIRPEDRPTPENTRVIMQQTIDEIIRYLPAIVTSEQKVKQIMSLRPLLLDPGMSGKDAARLMNRYGFEGYPVVRGKQLLGLLNRRNVDRALAHNIDKSVGDLMEAGDVSIHPEDTITRLKELMVSSGWGQIPVADPETGEIIGIVTRTDLIATLNNNISPIPRSELVEALQDALHGDRKLLLEAVAQEAAALNQPAYIVGGFVRDLLLRKPSQDFDIVIEGDAIAFANRLVAVYGGRIVVHERFGTAKWILSDQMDEIAIRLGLEGGKDRYDLPEHLDLISARTEFYDHPAALPVVERSSIKMDLHRRDFTINTLALRLDGEHFGQIFDFWGGYDDLQRGLIRVLHALSFVDDATRMLRAVRFSERFDFIIEERTLSLLKDSLPLLDRLSGARLQHEFDLIFLEGKVSQIMRSLEKLGILSSIHSELRWKKLDQDRTELFLSTAAESTLDLKEQQQAIWFLWLEDHKVDVLAEIASRLRLTSKQSEIIKQTGQLRRLLPGLKKLRPSQVTETLDVFPELVIRTVLYSEEDAGCQQILRDFLLHYRNVSAYTGGDDLRKRGISPSPLYEQILSRLKAAWLDGEVTSYEEEIVLLDSILETK